MYALTDPASRLHAECQATMLFDQLAAVESTLAEFGCEGQGFHSDDVVAICRNTERRYEAVIVKLVDMDIHDEFVRFMNEPRRLAPMTDAEFYHVLSVHAGHADELIETRQAGRR